MIIWTLITCAIITGIQPNKGQCYETNGNCFGVLDPSLYPHSVPYIANVMVPDFVCCEKQDCLHELGGSSLQLNPCAFYKECFDEQADEQASFIFDGVLRGFKIVDENAKIEGYRRRNYSSIRQGLFRKSMIDTIQSELLEGKVTEVDQLPKCVHAIGGIPKKDGSLRPITDCKRPIGKSINNFMVTTAKEFRFKTLDHVETLSPDFYLAVVDISSAYSSVPICEAHRTYQGFDR